VVYIYSKLLSDYRGIYIIYKCGNGQHNTAWGAASLTPLF